MIFRLIAHHMAKITVKPSFFGVQINGRSCFGANHACFVPICTSAPFGMLAVPRQSRHTVMGKAKTEKGTAKAKTAAVPAAGCLQQAVNR